MPRTTQFSVGRLWKAKRTDDNKAPLTFVIEGPGHSATTKRCRLEYDIKWFESRGYHGASRDNYMAQMHHGHVQEYSHAHLRKYATLVPVTE
jgi:hypothetical protein